MLNSLFKKKKKKICGRRGGYWNYEMNISGLAITVSNSFFPNFPFLSDFICTKSLIFLENIYTLMRV